MKILITGAEGQLGREAVQLMKSRGHEVHGMGRGDLDVADPRSCMSVIDRLRPEAVLHAAAYTAVDRAETDADTASKVNALGSRNVAAAAECAGAKLCYISTDYVFDGCADSPYGTDVLPFPLNVYGRTKLEGEHWTLSLSSRPFVVRTSWVYGQYGSNFVKTMLRLGQEGRKLTVVNDQFGCPTYTTDLAGLLEQLLQTDRYGVYHASNSGACSWYGFAKAIFEESGLDQSLLHPCSSEEYRQLARRPSYSVLSPDSLTDRGFKPLRPWREALREFIHMWIKDK
ncbi:dTDP-4-dehydrorhamnose reductase [Paenibacillus larvae]